MNCNKEGCAILWFMFVTHDSTAFVTIEKNQFTFFPCEMPSGVGQSFILLQSVIVGAQRIVVEKRRQQNERWDLPSQMKALFLCSFSCFYHCSLLICLLIVYRVIFLVQSNFWVCVLKKKLISFFICSLESTKCQPGKIWKHAETQDRGLQQLQSLGGAKRSPVQSQSATGGPTLQSQDRLSEDQSYAR